MSHECQRGANPICPANRVAALLTDEPEIERLSKQESDESTARYLSYYDNDLVVLENLYRLKRTAG